MPTVIEYDAANWMGQDGQILGTNPTSLLGVTAGHCSTVMSNVIVWSPVLSFGSPTHVLPGVSGSMGHMTKLTPTFIDPISGAISAPRARDPHPYWQWQAYGTAVNTLLGIADANDRSIPKAKGTGGAYSGSIPVIVDGVCYWVEVGRASQMPAIVKQALTDAGFSFA